MAKFERFTISFPDAPEDPFVNRNTPFFLDKKVQLLLLLCDLLLLLALYNYVFTPSDESSLRATGVTGDFKNSTISTGESQSTPTDDFVKVPALTADFENATVSTELNGEFQSAVSSTLQTSINVDYEVDGVDAGKVVDASLSADDRPLMGGNNSASGESEEAVGNELPKLSACGRRMIENENFVEDPGMNSYFGQYPWMLTLLYYNSRGAHVYKCGASLIAPNIALTAAHCVQYDVDYFVRAGDWFIGGNRHEEYLPPETRDVKRVSLHPQYNADTLENNIALLELADRIDYAEHIQPVCLMDWFVEVDVERCELTGWGRDGPAAPSNNKFLRRIGLSLLDKESCEKELRQTRLSQYFSLSYGSMCAWNRSSPVNSCKGDGGSPLVCPTVADPNQYVQLGIAIWSVECNPVIPDIFANVEAYRDWIDEVVMEFVTH